MAKRTSGGRTTSGQSDSSRPLLIVHGWSDHAGSFEHLARHLGERLGQQVTVINLVDWVSLDDDVTYEDLADGFQRAWLHHNLPTTGRGVDVVLHSTGGLVVRHWLTRHAESIKDPPIHHLLMLAPANFGSPLAHHGRSVMGRAKIGFQTAIGSKQSDGRRRAFETGDLLLRGLELGSPYAWHLAMQDRFGEHAAMYGRDRILTTVLVGNEGSVLMADFDGSDGVVRTATANLECSMATVEFPPHPKAAGQKRLKLRVTESGGRTAFRVVNGFNHGGIVLNDARLSSRKQGEKKSQFGVSQHDLLDLMVEALTRTDANFERWCIECEKATSELTATLDRARDDEVHGHCNLVVRVLNQYDQPVTDFVLEIYDDDEFDDESGLLVGARSRSITRDIQRHVIDDVHSYRFDGSYRCFHLDCAEFGEKIGPKLTDALSISITATPIVGDTPGGPRNTVGYASLDDEHIGRIVIPKDQLGQVFRGHRTMLLEIRLQRVQTDDLVRMRPADRG